MGQISSSIGLVSGINTSAIINDLLTLDQSPIQLLQAQETTANTQEQAYSSITTQLTSLQTISKALGQTSTFQAATTTSSNPNVLTATAGTGAALGSFQFQVARLVSTQQSITAGFSDPSSTPVGVGTITISQGGGELADPTTLASLNGGTGVASGTFKITDAGGNTAAIDTSNDITLDDVVNQINTATNIDVKASVGASGLVLQDLSGGTGTLNVQDVGNGQTAADLGIAGKATAGSLTGTAINTVGQGTALAQINDGRGIDIANNGQPDFSIATGGSTFNVNLAGAKTLGDVITDINTATGGSVTASVATDGQGLQLTDNTGSGSLTVTDLNSTAATDLGISASAGGSITGQPLVASLDSVLLSSLNGGKGLAVGTINITDRSGAAKSIDLTGALSVQDVLNDINTQGAGSVKASINTAGDGIQIQDVSGGTGNLTISDGDGNDAATALGIAGTFTNGQTVVQGSDLHRQYISAGTLLANYNGGKGVSAGTFTVTNSAGVSAQITLAATAVSLGDVINDINSRQIGVTASINTNGDGLLLTDTAGGAGKLAVTNGSSTTASDLNIAGTATGNTIDGSLTKTITVTQNDTLNSVVQKINAANAGVTANIVNDGSAGAPFRLSITSNNTGLDGRFTFDAGTTNLQASNLVDAQDAAVFVGGQGSAQPLLVTSSSNQLTNVINGVTISLVGASTTPVTLNVSQDTGSIQTQVQNYVTGFNTLVGVINGLSSFNTTTDQGGLLLGDATTQDVQEALYDGITNTVLTTGKYRTLADVGITVQQDGTLAFNTTTFQAALASDPTDVQNLFTQATTGAGAKITADITQLIDPENGSVTLQEQTLSAKVLDFQDRINELNQLLDDKRNLLEQQFANMETTLSTLQGQQAALATLSSTSTTSNSSTTANLSNIGPSNNSSSDSNSSSNSSSSDNSSTSTGSTSG